MEKKGLKNKAFVFTMDDNIRFLKALTTSGYPTLFSHPYTALLKKLHEAFGVKIQLNLFYQDETGFDLSMMTDAYRKEWESASNWLKLSFHSKGDLPRHPYENVGYGEVFQDCAAVHREILRFAGEKSLATTTTVHFVATTENGINALKDCGVKGLLGLYGTEGTPRVSYTNTESEAVVLRQGKCLEKQGMVYAGIDIVLDRWDIESIIRRLAEIKDRQVVKVMIHEQYFYEDFDRYQANFEEKLFTTMQYLTDRQFYSAFLEEVIAGHGEISYG